MGIPILKEIIQSAAVHEDRRGIDKAQAPRAGAIWFDAVAVIWVVPGGLWCVGDEGVRVALEIGGFVLDVAHEDVLGVDELVVVHDGVFGGGAVEPHGTLGLKKEAAVSRSVIGSSIWRGGMLLLHSPLIEDIDLVPIIEIQLMISHPTPRVLEISIRLRRDMQQEERAQTLRQHRIVPSNWYCRCLSTRVLLKICAGRAADTPMRIPHARHSWPGSLDVPLDDDCTGTGTFRLKHQIGDFDSADFSWTANLPYWYGIELVAKCAASSHDDGIELSRELLIGMYVDGV